MKSFILVIVFSFLTVSRSEAHEMDVPSLLWPGEKAVVVAKSKDLVLYRVTEGSEECRALILERKTSGVAIPLSDLSCEPMLTRAVIVPSSIDGYTKIVTFSGSEITGLMTVGN